MKTTSNLIFLLALFLSISSNFHCKRAPFSPSIILIDEGKNWRKYKIDTTESWFQNDSNELSDCGIIKVSNPTNDTILLHKSSVHKGDLYFPVHHTFYNLKGKDSLVLRGTSIGCLWSQNFDTLLPLQKDYYLTFIGGISDKRPFGLFEYPYYILGDIEKRRGERIMILSILKNENRLIQKEDTSKKKIYSLRKLKKL
jgi:hypothetical protein